MRGNEQREYSSRRRAGSKDTPKSKGLDSRRATAPTLTGNSNIDWCLWQLSQVLFDIARSIKKEEKTTDGDK